MFNIKYTTRYTLTASFFTQVSKFTVNFKEWINGVLNLVKHCSMIFAYQNTTMRTVCYLKSQVGILPEYSEYEYIALVRGPKTFHVWEVS